MVRKLLKAGLMAVATVAPAWCYGQDLRGALAPQRPDLMGHEMVDGHAPPPADFWGAGIGAPQIPPYLYHHPTYHLFHHPVFHNPIWHHPAYHAPFYPPTIHNPPNTYARRKWPCHGTGDLFPHIEWYPAAHGYWRFMPTTYEGIMLHTRVAPLLGGDSKNPYDNRHIDKLFDDLGYTEDEEQGVEEQATTETKPVKKVEDDEATPTDVKKPEETTEPKDGLDQSRRSTRPVRKAKRQMRQPIRTLSDTGFDFPVRASEGALQSLPSDGDEPALKGPIPSASSSRRGSYESSSTQRPSTTRTIASRPAAANQSAANQGVVQPEENTLYEPPVPLPAVTESKKVTETKRSPAPNGSSANGVRRANHEQPVQQKRNQGLLNRLWGSR